MKISSNPVRGMKDHTPYDTKLRDYTLRTLLETYQSFGFEKIETPCIENLKLLDNEDGGENQKMIYKILKRGKKLDLSKGITSTDNLSDEGLRFDLTVPLSRFYASNKSNLPYPLKSIQVGSVFRAERPQAGRLRQFMQCDIDIIGEHSLIAETELILATSKALMKLGFSDITVKINDRNILSAIVMDYACFERRDQSRVFIILDKLDKIGMSGVEQELLKSNFNIESINKIINLMKNMEDSIDSDDKLKKIREFVSKDIIESVEFVLKNIKESGINIVFDPNLVRGMGYYTGQIFEIVTEDYSSSIAGGGRYDNMLSKFIPSGVPACGLSIGFERIISILQEKKVFLDEDTNRRIVLLITDEQFKSNSTEICLYADKLRLEGYIISCVIKKKNLKKQLDDFKNQGYSKFIIYNESCTTEKFKIKELK